MGNRSWVGTGRTQVELQSPKGQGLVLGRVGFEAESGLSEESVEEGGLSLFFTIAASWSGVMQDPRLPRQFFMVD